MYNKKKTQEERRGFPMHTTKLRKLLALSLALVLILLCAGCRQEDVPETIEPPQVTAAEAAIGDTVHGFTLIQTEQIPTLKATMTKWQHDATGATAFFVLNEDPELGFTMSMRTEPQDESAIPLVLSECISAGSRDYPGTDLFSAAGKNAYVTSMGKLCNNAATGFYVTSPDEDQLEKMTDYYLDFAYNSTMGEQENNFLYYAWRHTLSGYNLPIELSGVVFHNRYNYHTAISTAHMAHVRQTLFPDSYQRFTGTPEGILELTQEEVVQYYKEVYHPSNTVCLFYGNLQPDRFLKRLNKEFSKFTKQEFTYSDGQAAFTEPVSATYTFAAAQDDNLGSTISYNAVLPQTLDFAQLCALQTGAAYLDDDNSLLMQRLKSSGIARTYLAQFRWVGDQAILRVQAAGADISRAEEFRQLVLQCVQSLGQNGLDESLLESHFEALRLKESLAFNATGIGVQMAQRLTAFVEHGYEEQLRHWAYSEDAYELSRNGGLAALLTQVLCDNPHAALVITESQPGGLEEQTAALEQTLGAKKQAMTPDQQKELILRTRDVMEWHYRLTPSNTLDYLCVDTKDIQVPTLTQYPAEEADVNGAKFYTARVSGDIVSCKVQYDLSHLTPEQIRTLLLYMDLMGGATENRTQEQLSKDMLALLSGFETQIHAVRLPDGRSAPALSVSFHTRAQTLEQAVALVTDMLRSTRTDANIIHLKNLIDARLRDYRLALEVTSTLAMRAALAASSEPAAIEYAIYDLNCRSHLAALRSTDPAMLYQQLRQVRDIAFVAGGTTVYAAADSGVDTASALSALIGSDTQVQPAEFWSTINCSTASSIGIKTTGDRCFLLSLLNLPALDIQPTAELMLCADLLKHQFMIPTYLYTGDSNMVNMSITETGIFLAQVYRTTSFAEIVEQLSSLPEEMHTKLAGLTPSVLAGYQYRRLNEMSRSQGIWNDAITQLQNDILGLTVPTRQAMLEQIHAATPTSVNAVADQMDQIMDTAVWAVVAPGDYIDKAPELFDEMIVLP